MYSWTIDNFRSFIQSDLQSTRFPADGCPQFYLWLSFTKTHLEPWCMWDQTRPNVKINFNCNISLLDGYGDCLTQLQDEGKNWSDDWLLVGTRILVDYDNIKGNRLTVNCTLSVCECDPSDAMEKIEFFNTGDRLKQQLSSDLAKFVSNQDMSDVILNVDNVAFPAHKFQSSIC